MCASDSFMRGDLDSFKTLLVLIADNELLEAITQWFEPLLNTTGNPYKDKNITIFHWLHAHSEIYRNYSATLERFIFTRTETSLHYFFMMRLYLNNHLDLFKMFLDQGFDPNGLGESGYQNNYLSLIKAIVYLNQSDNTHLYVKALLEKGAFLDTSNAPLEPYLDETTKKALVSRSSATNSKHNLKQETERLSLLPALLIGAQQNAFESIQTMIPYAEPYSLALALAAVMSDPNFFTRAWLYNIEGPAIALHPSQTHFTQAIKKPSMPSDHGLRIIVGYKATDSHHHAAWQALSKTYLAFLQKHNAEAKAMRSIQDLDYLLSQNTWCFRPYTFSVIYTAKILLLAQAHNHRALTPNAVENIFDAYHKMSLKNPPQKTYCLKQIKYIADAFHDLPITQLSQTLRDRALEALASEQETSQSSAPLLHQYAERTTARLERRPGRQSQSLAPGKAQIPN